jgi:hypothetical protein
MSGTGFQRHLLIGLPSVMLNAVRRPPTGRGAQGDASEQGDGTAQGGTEHQGRAVAFCLVPCGFGFEAGSTFTVAFFGDLG